MGSKSNNSRLIIVILLLLSFGLFHSQSAAQRKKTTRKTSVAVKQSPCKIGNTAFRCSKYFLKDEAVTENTLLFKGKPPYENSILFVSIPGSGAFDEDKVKNKIADNLSLGNSEKFVWREIDPALMSLESSFEKAQKSSVGFGGTSLIHFISRQFNFKDQNIIVGYGYRATDVATKAEFERWLGGDNAMACNEIATIINSITKESKDVEQYCFLTGFAPQD